MRITKADRHNLINLYGLNKTLASEENQSHLFTAEIVHFQTAFIGEYPAVGAYLCMVDDVSIGFYTYVYKFATYLGTKVLHIEGIYLSEVHREEYIEEVLAHAIQKASIDGWCRVEMRVLKSFNMGYEAIGSAGFRKVEKWDVFRYESSLWEKYSNKRMQWKNLKKWFRFATPFFKNPPLICDCR